MKAALSKPRLGSRGRPEESRAAILQAAVREFSREGVAGARTDAIARAAGVNKALLYYYFKDKETLYGAVLDQVFGGLKESIEDGAVQRSASAGKIAGLRGRALRLHCQPSPLSQNHAERNDARGARQSATPEAHCEAILRPAVRQSCIRDRGRPGDGRLPSRGPHALCSLHDRDHRFSFHQCASSAHGQRDRSPGAGMVAARRAAVMDFISAALFRQQANSKGARN